MTKIYNKNVCKIEIVQQGTIILRPGKFLTIIFDNRYLSLVSSVCRFIAQYTKFLFLKPSVFDEGL